MTDRAEDGAVAAAGTDCGKAPSAPWLDAPHGDRFRSLIQHSCDMVSIYDRNGRFLFASPSHARVLGYEPEELVGRSPLEFLHPDEIERVAEEFAGQLLGERPPAPVEHRFRCKDGSWRYLESVAVDLTSEPAIGGVLVNARDVTHRRRAEMLVVDQAALLEGIAQGVPLVTTLQAVCEMVDRWIDESRAAVTLVDEAERVLRVVAAPHLPPECWDAIDGFPVSRDVAGLSEALAASEVVVDDVWPGVGAALAEAGYRCWWAAPVRAPSGDRALGAVVVLRRDRARPTPPEEQVLTMAGTIAAIAVERHRSQAWLAHQALHDTLTGLPNREQVLERLRRITSSPRKGGEHAAVLFLDLDRFKVLNDSVGHDAGDRLLVELGRRLRAALRPGDVVARFGGDEFVIVCEGLDDIESVLALAERLLDVVQRPFPLGDSELVVSASIGVALVDGRAPEALLRDADAAMYRAKERGRARVDLFDDELRARVVERLETERDLRHALERGEFVLHYQPVMGLVHGRTAGFEALLRWNHPTRGLLDPWAFLDVAEDCGLIWRLGAFAREAACRQWASWRDAHPEWGEFLMGINLSASELNDPNLVSSVERLIKETGVDPGLCSFEIGERSLSTDRVGVSTAIEELRDLGVLLALDDFGTGSSPLLHLRRLPIDALKIDRTFVGRVGRDRHDDSIVASVIRLAHEVGLFAVAVGVETAEQAERLRGYGCLLAQGFAFAPAMPADQIEAWMRDQLAAAR